MGLKMGWVAYLAILRTSAQQAIAYRVTTIAGLIANFFWIAILFYLWEAAFSQQAQIGSFNWSEMRTYILLAYSINALLGFSASYRLMNSIRTGDVVIDMIRPLNYLGAQLAQSVGSAILYGVFGFSITLTLGILVVHVVPPISPLAALLFVISLAMGFVIKFLVIFSVSLLCFWTTNAVGLIWAQTAVIGVLSGTLVPIEFLPGWLQPVAEWSPLRGVVATPLGIYLGQYDGWALAAAMAAQCGWLVLLWLFSDLAWPRAFRAADIQGG